MRSKHKPKKAVLGRTAFFFIGILLFITSPTRETHGADEKVLLPSLCQLTLEGHNSGSLVATQPTEFISPEAAMLRLEQRHPLPFLPSSGGAFTVLVRFQLDRPIAISPKENSSPWVELTDRPQPSIATLRENLQDEFDIPSLQAGFLNLSSDEFNSDRLVMVIHDELARVHSALDFVDTANLGDSVNNLSVAFASTPPEAITELVHFLQQDITYTTKHPTPNSSVQPPNLVNAAEDLQEILSTVPRPTPAAQKLFQHHNLVLISSLSPQLQYLINLVQAPNSRKPVQIRPLPISSVLNESPSQLARGLDDVIAGKQVWTLAATDPITLQEGQIQGGTLMSLSLHRDLLAMTLSLVEQAKQGFQLPPQIRSDVTGNSEEFNRKFDPIWAIETIRRQTGFRPLFQPMPVSKNMIETQSLAYSPAGQRNSYLKEHSLFELIRNHPAPPGQLHPENVAEYYLQHLVALALQKGLISKEDEVDLMLKLESDQRLQHLRNVKDPAQKQLAKNSFLEFLSLVSVAISKVMDHYPRSGDLFDPTKIENANQAKQLDDYIRQHPPLRSRPLFHLNPANLTQRSVIGEDLSRLQKLAGSIAEELGLDPSTTTIEKWLEAMVQQLFRSQQLLRLLNVEAENFISEIDFIKIMEATKGPGRTKSLSQLSSIMLQARPSSRVELKLYLFDLLWLWQRGSYSRPVQLFTPKRLETTSGVADFLALYLKHVLHQY